MNARVLMTAVAVTAVTAILVPAVALSARTKEYDYVSDQVLLPTTNSQARDFGRNMDGQAGGDNALGQVFATFSSQGLDVQSAVDSAVNSGQLLMLHSLRTPSLTATKDATWQVLYAQPNPTPDFSGAGSFTVGSQRSPWLPAKIKNGHVKTGAGTIPLLMTFGGDVFPLSLKQGKVFATCTKLGCTSGRINGAVTADKVDSTLIPAMADQFTAIVARDCPGPTSSSCASDSYGKSIEQLFDSNGDLVITADELRQNSLVQHLLEPDLDLFKANGKPGHDGVADSLSFGIGFDAVHAHLVR